MNMKLGFKKIFLQMVLMNVRISSSKSTGHKTILNLTNFYENDIYVPGKTSFLEYMLKLKESTEANKSKLETECLKNDFAFTKYNSLVYIYACCSSKTTFNDICKLQLHNTDKMKRNLSFYLLQNSTKEEESYRCPKFKTEDSAQTKQDCHLIESYFKIRRVFKRMSKNNFSLSAPHKKELHYFENIIEDMPFCNSFSCPYWIASEKSKNTLSSLYKCMPTSCQKVFWTIALLDTFLAFSIVTANLIIIIVISKTPCLLTPHG